MLDPRLSYVIAIGREGSFTAAADALGVSQSAMSKNVASLEHEIGYPIFYRSRSGAMATEQGRDFIERAIRVIEDAKELLRRPSGIGDVFASTLKIGVCPASLEWQVVEPLESLLKHHPSVRVEITGTSFERIVQHLRTGTVDLAIGFDAAFAGCTDFTRKPLGTLRSTLFVRLGHALLEQQPLTLSNLAKFDFVSPSLSKPYGAPIRALYENNGTDWRRKVHTVDYFPAVARIVKITDAIGMVNRAYTRSESFGRTFAMLDHPDFFRPAPLCCAYRIRRKPSPASSAFIEAMARSTRRLA